MVLCSIVIVVILFFAKRRRYRGTSTFIAALPGREDRNPRR